MIVIDIPSNILAGLGNLPASYVHHDRWVEPRELLVLPGAVLKWYNVGRPGTEIPSILEEEGRRFLATEIAADRFTLGHGFGWVVLHDCQGVTFLILGIWNGHNECWQVAFARDPDKPELCYRPVDIAGMPKPVLCVWEMTPVWHERNAWSRYLFSTRDEAAKIAFLQDQTSGTA